MDDVEMSDVGAEAAPEAGAQVEASASAPDYGEKIMADSGVAATVSVSLHPLVIMNISEHWTRYNACVNLDKAHLQRSDCHYCRTKAQEGRPTPVFGALIGKQNGRDIELMNSFELALDQQLSTTEAVVIDLEYYKVKEEQFKQVFSDMDFLGWYSTGDQPTMLDINVHKQICEINESPLFLQLSPGKQNTTELPVSLYESVIDMIGGQGLLRKYDTFLFID